MIYQAYYTFTGKVLQWDKAEKGRYTINNKIIPLPMTRNEADTFKEMEGLNIKKNIEPGKIYTIMD